ncbi:MAG: hypothetical protein O7J95_13790 [Planctomycetota bacterium]|nr:hypothetical protein [Planctomycetota bacterium]
MSQATSLSPPGIEQPDDAPRRNLAALSRLRHRLRRVHLLDGLLATGLIVGAGLCLSFALDYLLDVPRGVRGLFLVGAGGGLLILLFRRLWRPLSLQLSDEHLALLVEECNPGLKQSLITAIELSRQESEGSRYVSPELLGSVVKEVETEVHQTSFDRVIRLGRLRRNALGLFALVIAIYSGGASAPELARIWLQRNLLLGAERWPQETVLEQFPSIPETVAVGDSLLVHVRVLKGDPKLVSVQRQLRDGGTSSRLMDRREKSSWDVELGRSDAEPSTARGVLTATGRLTEEAASSVERGSGPLARGITQQEAKDLEERLRESGHEVLLRGYDTFVHEFKNISTSFRFWVEGGDDRIGPFDVQVRLRPRLDPQSIHVSYRYPVYTGRDQEEHVQRYGNLKLPVATLVNYRMATNIPVKEAFRVLRHGGRGSSSSAVAKNDDERWPGPNAVRQKLEDGRHFSGSFVIRESGHYYFTFEDEQGFRSGKPEMFRMQAIPDRKPDVRIVEPERMTEEVSPEAKVAIRVVLEDDYGIRRAVLEGRYYAPDQDVPVEQSFALAIEAADPSQALAEPPPVEFSLDIPQLKTESEKKPEIGARFEFWVLAEDFGETGKTGEDGQPVGNVGSSQVYRLHIVGPEHLQRLLTDQLMIVRDQLSQLLARQQAVRKNLESFEDRVLLAGRIAKHDAIELSRHRRDQGKIGEGLERQAKEVERVLAKMNSNAVGDERWKKWVSDIRDDIDQLARRQSSEVEEKIETLRREAQESPQQAGQVTPIIGGQRRLERALRTLVMRLEEFGDKRALLELLREALKRQIDLRDATLDQLPESGASGSDT